MKLPDDFIVVKDDTISRIWKRGNNSYDVFEWDYSDWLLVRAYIKTKEAQKYYTGAVSVYVRQIRKD